MATIVDQHGKPITQEIATIQRNPLVSYFGSTLQNEDDTLRTRGRGKGLKIYQELKRDCHAGAVLGKRKLAVTSRPWEVKAASKAPRDIEAADLVRSAFEYLRFNAINKRLLEAVLNGYAVGEVIWEVRDGKWLPAAVKGRDPRRFTFTLDSELRLLTREKPQEGEELPDRKFIVHRHGGEDDTPYGLGIGSMLFWPVFFKRQGITFWLTFADKFGSPTAVGKYHPGASKEDQKKLLGALSAIAQDAGVIVPEGMAIELLEATRSGSIDTYEKLVRYMDEQISKAVLGETMSTTAAATGLGSNQASVHNDVRLELAEDDADELCETLNSSLVKWIVEYNVVGAGLPKLCRNFAEPEDLTARASRDKTITELGYEPTEQYILDTYGEGWVKKAAPAVDPMLALGGFAPGRAGEPANDGNVGDSAGDPAEKDATNFAEGARLQAATSQRAFNKLRQEAITTASQALAKEYQTVMGSRVQDLVAALEETGDLVSFRERLTGFANAPPDPAAVDVIARATFAGNLMGRGLAPKPPGFIDRLKALVTRRTS